MGESEASKMRGFWTSHSVPACSSDVSGAQVIGYFCTKLDKSESAAPSTGCSRFSPHFLFFFFSLLPLLFPFVSLLYPEFSGFLIKVSRRSSNVAVGFSFLLCITSTRNLVRVINRDDDRNSSCLIVSFKPWEEHRLLDKVTAALF